LHTLLVARFSFLVARFQVLSAPFLGSRKLHRLVRTPTVCSLSIAFLCVLAPLR
jgi:hypothetical protein